MHRLFLIATILAGLLFPFPSASQEVRKDVQELYQLCKHESGKDFCLGYISGVADHMFLNGAFLRSHGKGFKEEDRDLLVDLSACLKAPTARLWSFGRVPVSSCGSLSTKVRD